MSYEKLKSISTDGQHVLFMNKSNNTTEPYRHNSCSVIDFLHNSIGSVFQYSNKKINALVSECKKELNRSESEDSFWWMVENYGLESSKITSDERAIFYKYCEKITGNPIAPHDEKFVTQN